MIRRVKNNAENEREERAWVERDLRGALARTAFGPELGWAQRVGDNALHLRVEGGDDFRVEERVGGDR